MKKPARAQCRAGDGGRGARRSPRDRRATDSLLRRTAGVGKTSPAIDRAHRAEVRPLSPRGRATGHRGHHGHIGACRAGSSASALARPGLHAGRDRQVCTMGDHPRPFEVLDPAGNNTFVDTISAFLRPRRSFIATANTLATIPAAARSHGILQPPATPSSRKSASPRRTSLKQIVTTAQPAGSRSTTMRCSRSCAPTRVRPASGTSTGRSRRSSGRWRVRSPRERRSRSTSPPT